MTGASARTRTIECAQRIDAAPDVVWRAISSGEGLKRWFAPIAAVDPGEGGAVTVAWEAGSEWTSRISVWEPGVRLRLADMAAGGEEAAMVLTYELAPLDGGTEVRIVNSGLPGSRDWDEPMRMMTNGWHVFIWMLRHSLERHRDVPRRVVSARPWVQGSRPDVWDRLFGMGAPGVLPRQGRRVHEAPAGGPFRMVLDGGTVLEGTTVWQDRPWAFAGLVRSLGDGVLHVELEGSGNRWKLGVWLSLWGVGDAKRHGVQTHLDATIDRLFPDNDAL